MKKITIVFILCIFSVKGYYAQTTTETVYEVDSKELSESPILENELEVKDWLYSNNKYLEKEKKLRGYDKVTVILTIDENGDIIKARAWRGIDMPYDGEAIRLMNELPFKWKPAIKDGVNVKAQVYYIIDFIKYKK